MAFNQEKALVGAISMIVKLLVIFGNLRFKLYPGRVGAGSTQRPGHPHTHTGAVKLISVGSKLG